MSQTEKPLFWCNRLRKITEQDVKFIRKSKSSLRKLGRFFNVTHKTIHYWKSDLNRKESIIRTTITKQESRRRKNITAVSL